MKIEVTSCGDCPALWQNSEYPESVCKISNRDFGWGHYSRGDPAPEWCPLRGGPVAISMAKSRDKRWFET